MGETAKRCEQAIDLVMSSLKTTHGQVVVIAIDGKGRTAMHTREKVEGTNRLDGELTLALRHLLLRLDLAYEKRIESHREGPPADEEP